MEEFNSDDKTEQNEELIIEKSHENKSLITFSKLNKYFLILALFTIFNFLSSLKSSFMSLI